MLIPKGLIHATRNFPGKPALICNDRTYTYAEFFDRAAKIKGSLSKLGIKKGDRVACLLLNDFRYMELFYGVTSLGAVIVPVNTRYSQEEISFTINDSGAEILYIHKEFLSIIHEIKLNTSTLRHIILAEDENVFDISTNEDILCYERLLNEQIDGEISTEHLKEDDVAAIYYTGGTTGRSKGVMLTHKNLVFNAYQKQALYDCDENDIYLHAAPMFHLADGGQMLAFTSFGAAHTFVRSFTPKNVLEVINDKKVTFTLLVPTMINTLVNTPEIDQYDVSTLKTIVYGASPISLDVLKKAIVKLPNIEIIQEYGMTETSPILTILPGKDHVITGTEQQMKRLASCGRPV